MDLLSKPKKDLEIALSEISKMKSAKTFNQFLENWENFLFRIDRCGDVTGIILENQVKDYGQWKKPYAKLRKKEPLLKYLKQARNAEMHGISESVSASSGIEIEDKTGRGMQIKAIEYTLKEGLLEINLKTNDLFTDVNVKLMPIDPKLVKVQNRSKWYNPPKTYLGNKIDDLHPISIAEIGYKFYKSYISDAERWLNK